MVISFTDRLGRTGTVTRDLEVRYDGPWRDEVEAYVDYLEREYQTEQDNVDLPLVAHELLIVLPEQLPVSDVKQREIDE